MAYAYSASLGQSACSIDLWPKHCVRIVSAKVLYVYIIGSSAVSVAWVNYWPECIRVSLWPKRCSQPKCYYLGLVAEALLGYLPLARVPLASVYGHSAVCISHRLHTYSASAMNQCCKCSGQGHILGP